jgi:hypothetical protein
LRSAIGFNNEVAYQWRLGSPGVTAAWSVRLRRICVRRRLEIILPSFFLLSYRLSASFLSLPLRPLLIFPTLYARSGGLLLE